jgi:hypothetical protein
MRTLLTETPVGPVSAPVVVVVLAADEPETLRAPAPVAAEPGPSLRAPKLPADLLHYSALTQARRSTSAKLSGLELPSCFIEATVSAALNAHERTSASAKASRRRLLDKATRLAGVES